MAIARNFTVKVIENRRNFLLNAAINNNDDDEEDREDGGKIKGLCFVDILLQSTINGQPLPNEDILDHMHTLMIGVSVSNTVFDHYFCDEDD